MASLDVARIGSLPSSLPLPSLPHTSVTEIKDLMSAGIAVALLAAIESLLSARVADGMSDAARHDPDRELFGQGLANVVSPLFGGMPATGAIARTAVNVRAGARTRVAAFTHAIVLMLVVFFGGPLVSEIPLAALAGVLMVTAIRMVEIHNVRAYCARRDPTPWFWASLPRQRSPSTSLSLSRSVLPSLWCWHFAMLPSTAGPRLNHCRSTRWSPIVRKLGSCTSTSSSIAWTARCSLAPRSGSSPSSPRSATSRS